MSRGFVQGFRALGVSEPWDAEFADAFTAVGVLGLRFIRNPEA